MPKYRPPRRVNTSWRIDAGHADRDSRVRRACCSAKAMLTCIGPPVRTGLQSANRRLPQRHLVDEVLEDLAEFASRSAPRRCARRSCCRWATRSAAPASHRKPGHAAGARRAGRSPRARSRQVRHRGIGLEGRLLLGHGDHGTDVLCDSARCRARRRRRRCPPPSRRGPAYWRAAGSRSALAPRPVAAAGSRRRSSPAQPASTAMPRTTSHAPTRQENGMAANGLAKGFGR